MKDKKLKDCDYCQKEIFEGINNIALCVAEKQNIADYKIENFLYHQECYKKKHGIPIDVNEKVEKLRKEIREMITVGHSIPEE